MGEHILLYRREDGTAVAMTDRCPHRFAPMHQGKLVGDVIACPYHGLAFGSDGQCVHNPHDAKIPSNARLAVYPLVERQHVAWIWMGKTADADIALIPDHPELTEDSEWKTLRGYLEVKANYSLVVDNLLDLTHSAYLHGDSVSVPASVRLPITQSGTEADGIYSRFITPDVPPPLPFRAHWTHAQCDYHRIVRWTVPSIVRTTIGISPLDGALADGLFIQGYHFLTPESEQRTHYFWSASRTFAADDATYDMRLRAVVEQAFMTEDEPMIAACQRYMGENDLYDLSPVLLKTDKASVLARRALQKHIKERDDS